MLILRNCRLIAELTEDYDNATGDILIDEPYIVDIKNAGHDFKVKCPEIDLNGKTVVPGFFELHTHLYLFICEPYKLQAMTASDVTFGAYSFAKAYLKAGFTTVRDCGSTHNCAAAIRDAINTGIVEGPRIISSGLIVTPTENGNKTFADLYWEADGPEEIRKACRAELQKGNDFIKIMASGAFMNEGGDPGVQIMEEDEIRAAVAVARRKGTYVAAHCHGTESIKAAIRSGVRTIEHATFIDDEAIELLRNRTDCYIIPTGALLLNVLDKSVHDISEEYADKSKRYKGEEVKNINKAYTAGLKIGFGSDVDYEAFKIRPGAEFIARKELYGFPDLDILIQATKNSAEIACCDDMLGTIKVGKLADIVVIDGHPDKDIYVATKPPSMVIKNGKVCK